LARRSLSVRRAQHTTGRAGRQVRRRRAQAAALASFLRPERSEGAVNGLRVLAVFGDDTRALIMYEMTTGRFGTLTCAKLLTFSGDKIQTDRLTFDSYELRKAQGG
jgi:hypothetical protein